MLADDLRRLLERKKKLQSDIDQDARMGHNLDPQCRSVVGNTSA